MGSPGIPARLRKIAALSELGSAGTDAAGSVLPGSLSPGSSAAAGPLPAPVPDDEPDVTAHFVDTAVLEFVEEPTVTPPALLTLGPRRVGRSVRPRRGRPRSEHADRVILLATNDVIADKGVSGLTIEEVAARAGVGKTTIYRRWSSRGTLALDAFLAEIGEQQTPRDTGSLSGDLRAALGEWVGAVAGANAGIMLAGLIAEMHKDRGLAVAWQDQVISPLRAQYSMMLDRAISRGEIPSNTDAGVVLDLLFGACYYRLLHGHRPLNDQFVNQVVDIVALGVGAHSNLAARAARRPVRH